MTDRELWIAVAAAAVFLMGALSVLAWRRREKDMRPVWMGMLGFLGFAVIAESFFELICFTALGPVTRALNASFARLIAFSCLCAGLFEECGRWWIYRNGLAAYRGRAVAAGYAIGHFSAEIVAFCLWPL
ncbi:MAG: YhfC family intramembrane metalloprotease, partial [Clostridia bacterium]|nr:YhfC family intramembrane metalloprotease [Clostridia bacterium]